MTFKSNKNKDSEKLEFGIILGSFLKFQREYDTISLNYVAESLHMNKGYLSEIENGKKCLSIENYEKLMEFYDIEFDYERNILIEIRNHLYEVYESYINLDVEDEQEKFKELFLKKNRYINSYGFFTYQLLNLIFYIHFESSQIERINNLIKLINDYIFIYSLEEKTIFFDVLAQYYLLMKNIKEANTSIEKAKKICPGEPKTAGLYSIILYHKVILLQHSNKSFDAYKWCMKAMVECRKERIYHRLYYLDIHEGNCLSRMRMYDEAENTYLSVLNHISFYDNKLLICTAYDNLSWNSLKAGRYEDCIVYARQSIDYGKNGNQVYTFIPYSLYKLNRILDCLEEIRNLNEKIIGSYYMKLVNIIKYKVIGNKENFMNETEIFLDLCEAEGDYETELLVRSLQIEFFKEEKDYKRLAQIQDRVISILY